MLAALSKFIPDNVKPVYISELLYCVIARFTHSGKSGEIRGIKQTLKNQQKSGKTLNILYKS